MFNYNWMETWADMKLKIWLEFRLLICVFMLDNVLHELNFKCYIKISTLFGPTHPSFYTTSFQFMFLCGITENTCKLRKVCGNWISFWKIKQFFLKGKHKNHSFICFFFKQQYELLKAEFNYILKWEKPSISNNNVTRAKKEF